MGRKRGVQYKPGSFYRSDDRSGFTQRAENTEKEWTELIVAKELWETRQPQDFVRGVPDDQTVSNPRLVPPATFVGPFSIPFRLAAVVRQQIVFLDNVTGLSVLDPVGVMTGLGGYFYTFIHAIMYDEAAVILGAPLPYDVPVGNILTDFLTPQASPPEWSMDFSNLFNSGYVATIAGNC